MKKQAGRIMIPVILGAALLSGWIWTGKQSVSEEDQRIYEEALDLQKQVDTLGFKDFCLEDYPVAVYDGDSDYVFYKGEVKKREPVLQTFAGTAYPVEDHFEVIVPTVGQFNSLMSLAGGVEGMVTGSGYGAEEQKSTIWHEAFHAYQLTDYAILGEKVTADKMRKDLEDNSGRSEEEWIVKEVDEKGDIQKKLKEELRLLKRAVEIVRTGSPYTAKENEPKAGTASGAGTDTVDIDELQSIILEYSKSRRQRMEEMPREAKEAEIRCELTEGTAYYVEASVYQMLCGGQAYHERYLDGLDVYEGGRGKYYRTGFAKCLLLDYLNPGWKEAFDFTKGLDEALAEYIK